MAINSTAITTGTRVETGETGTPSHRTGLVLGVGSAAQLGRAKGEGSALVIWESGEQEWAELSTLRRAV